jgi:hypothetical protein
MQSTTAPQLQGTSEIARHINTLHGDEQLRSRLDDDTARRWLGISANLMIDLVSAGVDVERAFGIARDVMVAINGVD